MAINSPLNQKYSMKAIRTGIVGAAPLDKHPQGRMQVLLGNKPLTQVWGMTETCCVATRLRYPTFDNTGSVGTPLPNLDIKLVDDAGKDISGFDVRGELCIRGPTVIRGYFENEEANKRDFDEEGYFHTGDIAYVARVSGLYYIVDRKKVSLPVLISKKGSQGTLANNISQELIKVRGFQVAPPELEGVLLSHPDIVDCAVIGVADPVRTQDEVPRGYVVRRPGSSGPSDKELHAYMRERLSSFKMLEGGIRWVELIPKNASGKILKRILREEAKREAGAKL
jgi:4-coumarate--CoA ligase